MKRYLIASFLLAFIISFITTIFIFPKSQILLTMNISQGVKISTELLIKIVFTLVIQTAILGSIFHFFVKRLFVDKSNSLEIK